MRRELVDGARRLPRRGKLDADEVGALGLNPALADDVVVDDAPPGHGEAERGGRWPRLRRGHGDGRVGRVHFL